MLWEDNLLRVVIITVVGERNTILTQSWLRLDVQ